MVRAGAGIFGKQAAPTAITLLAVWPIGVTMGLVQVWGIVREAGLDNEAVRVVELSLTRAQRLAGSSGGSANGQFRAPETVPNGSPGRFGAATAANTARAHPVQADSREGFCIGCGRRLEEGARFCAGCGQAVPAG
jgi:hypothetical protein